MAHTLESLELYTRYFRSRYFRGLPSGGQPTWEQAEGEFWRVVEKGGGGAMAAPGIHCEVIYGADVDTGIVGSGAPSKEREKEREGKEETGRGIESVSGRILEERLNA